MIRIRATLIAAASILAIASTSRLAAREPAGLGAAGMQFRILSPVSDAFQKEAFAAAASIPDPIWQAVVKAGWQVRMAEFTVDAQPALKHDRPRGWPADTTWLNTDAMHLPYERLLVLAEKRRNKKGEVVAASRVGGVLRHELGHAFDMTIGGEWRFRSAAPDFCQAYSSDLNRMAAQHGIDLAYYRQESDAGRQEAFAEAFGILLGGGSDSKNTELFQTNFGQVIKIVQKTIADHSH